METTYYTFTANEIIVAGDGVRQVSGGEGRRLVYTRRTSVAEPSSRVESNVVDFSAWRAAHVRPEPVCEDGAEDGFSVEYAPVERYAPSVTRTARTARGMYLDTVASLALIAVALSACISFLL